MAEKQQLSPAQRAILFAQQTRQYEQEISSMVFKEGETISTNFPKTRFLSKIYLKVKGSITLKHETKTTYTASNFDMYRLLRQIRVKINNGFTPYQVGGVELYLYNLMNKENLVIDDNFSVDYLGNVVSPAGAVNKINYTLELPITLNDRDSIGLLLLQNEQTVVSLEIDCGNIKDIMTDTDVEVTGYNINVTPILETFSIPQDKNAIPDYSIIKLVNEQIENVTSVGDMIVKLQTGLTYRKFLVYIAKDSKFTPFEHEKLDRFSLVMNQADIPYNISADHVAYKNRIAYGGKLPKGCYAFDFSTQGYANYGGSRDYIDTERLTEFWLKINFKEIEGTNTNVYIIAEKLARLV